MKNVFSLSLLALAFSFAIWPETVIGGAEGAMEMCAHHIVPSLFPFLVCANVLLSQGFAEKAGRVLSPFTEKIFRIKGAGSAAIILGFLSGYPSGAIVSAGLFEKGSITKSEAERLIAFTNNPGPLFVLGTVGTSLYGDKRVGIILYFSLLVASVLTGVFMRFFGKAQTTLKRKEQKKERDPMGEAVHTILMLLGYVVFFSVLLAFARKWGICDWIEKGIMKCGLSAKTASLLSVGIFEISTAAKMGGPLPAMAGLLAFGGLSVLMQTAAVTKKAGLSVKAYLIGKGISAILAAVICTFILKGFPISAQVAAVISRDVPSVSLVSLPAVLSVAVYMFFSVLSKKST